ncbi:hypothetical protein JCM10207_004809 [Rhodosporidiobolus poonsookiae]
MAARNLTRSTAYGPVTGFSDTYPLRLTSSANEPADGGKEPVLKWLGIPYARAERWKRPEAPAQWTEPRECFEFGSMFPQPPSNTEMLLSKLPGFLLRTHIPVSEDSHHINVFTPGDVQEGETLPVLVWIYGGALNNGTADRFFYDPTEWIRDGAKRGQRCIVVTGNYRTNIFGFLAHSDLASEDPAGLCGNYGLYDCVAMLEWVQSNIASFGGDPSKVTAFGQSAGAFLVAQLLVSGKRLFRKAICQSGAVNTMALRPVDKAYPAYPSILSSLSIPEAASPAEKLAALRAASWQDLLDLHKASHSFTGLSLALESKEGGTWTSDTMARLRKGEWDEWIEGVVIGVVEDEGSAFAWGMKLTHPAAYAGYVSQFPSSLQPAIHAKYLRPFSGTHPAPDDPALDLTTAPGSHIIADQVFVNPVWDQAVAMSGRNEKKRETRTWMYRLETGVENVTKYSPVKLGVFHAIDLPLVFNSSSLWAGDAESSDAKTAQALGERWFRFASEGNPDPSWQPFTPSAPSQLVFSDAGAVENVSLADFEADKLELFFEGHEQEGAGEELLGHENE